MDFCSLADLKTYLKISGSETQYDAELSDLITAVSKRMEEYLGRYALVSSYTEYLDVLPEQTVFLLRGYPISSITSVSNSPSWDFSTTISNDYYSTEDDLGLLFFKYDVLAEGPRALKVVYTGGMASDTSGFKTAFPDLYNACIRQCAYLFRTGRHIGTTSVNVQTGSASFLTPDDWLPDVKGDLNRHRRLIV